MNDEAASAGRDGADGRPGTARPGMTHSPAQLDGSPERSLYSGSDPQRAVAVADLRAMAHRFLPDLALDYLEGGAEQEQTLARNLATLAQWRFVPRALQDVADRSARSMLFGRPMPLPLVIAPTGLNGLFRAGADRMLAEAAAEMGVPFTQSTMSNQAMEKVRDGLELRHWWQLYVFGAREVWETLIARAERNGCEALVVTIDAQIYGNRVWDSRNFTTPGHLTWHAMLEAARHPRWMADNLVRRGGMPVFENIIDFIPREHHGFYDSAFWVRGQMKDDLDWDVIRHIRGLWPRTLLVKGLLRAEEALAAAEAGADGVVLSDHGGRQLDGSVAPLDVLPDARRLVGDRIAILVDGGIRRGADIVKAVALGADAVQVGRAALYGVAAAGREGALRALTILHEEMVRTMGLLGVASVDQLGPDILTR